MADRGALDRHHPGLDGIRAVAVTVVLAYHGQLPWVQGAFLGISQFFTLSGFLITSMLLRRQPGDGGLDLRRFWSRRYRRLMPAAYLTLAGVVLFGATVATQQQLENLPGDVAAAALQVANWHFILSDQSYVSLFTAPSPVQHFWSLAIEEQFYLLLPLVVLVLRRRSPATIGVVLAGGAAASTLLMAGLFEGGASLDRLYYGTDTRAAELLTGAVLGAVLAARPLRLGPGARKAVAGLSALAFGLTLWGWTAIQLTDAALWRGGFLAFSLLTVVLVLDVLGAHGPVARGLGWAPIAAMGRVSYGLYLFHWPVFLWLDADRTGLDVWPLFVLRMAVTSAITIASYHLLEMPIRERRWPTRPDTLKWLVAPSAATLVLAALFVAERDVDSALAGLGEEVADAPDVAGPTGPFEVLVIADEAGMPFAGQLEQLAAADGSDLEVSVLPFSCGGPAPADAGPICADWAARWPAAVAEAQPEIVLFDVTDWSRDELATLAGSDDLDATTAFARQALDAGFDLLTEGGALVVWTSSQPGDISAALRNRDGPFFRAAQALTSARIDARRAHHLAVDPEVTVSELRLLRPRGGGDAPRVLVVGDSTARTLGYGLERWAADTGEATVWSAGIEGCGLVAEGEVQDQSGRPIDVPIECRSVADGWAQQIAQFDPDVVVVSSTLFDLPARRIDGWEGFLAPGDPRFDQFLIDTYVAAVDTLTAGGATVVWMESPCVSPVFEVASDPHTLDADRISHVNDVVLGAVVAARPRVRLFDLAEVLCPGGELLVSVDGVDVVRPDGIHLGEDGSLWLAETYGHEILQLGLE
jgi:peptidoglycan/LPS O-acetylase OafA/YrhL